ncbi:MAG: hypothetical protein V3U48_01435 [Rhodospirillales bacterium]
MADEQKIPEPIPDRRTGKDRRLEEQEREPEPERRSGDGRRQQPDRRGVHRSFKFVSPDAVEELRQWLEANCEGEFTIDIPDMEVTAQRGQFRVQFERESDLAKLGKMLGVYWPSWMG